MSNGAHWAAESRVLVPLRHPVGGIRTYILYNYPTLQEAGYRFTFVGPANDSFRALRSELQSWKGAEFVEAPVHGRKCKMRRTVRRLLHEKRFCLIHSQGFTAAVESVLANLGLRIPHLVTSHDVVRPEVHFCGLKGKVKRFLLGWLLSRADRIIAVSHDARENHLQCLPALRRHSDRVITIVNGIDTTRFAEETQRNGDLRRRLGIAEDTYLMGFLGRFMEQKGFLVLVDALDQLASSGTPRPFHLLAVGSGDYVREYRAEVGRRSSLSSHITFLALTPDVAPILRELDVLVMPSLWEACPLLPMEAMCMGVPVLGSDCIGLREVLGGTPSRIVEAGDACQWASALRRAMIERWDASARENAARACERFDNKCPAARLLALIRDMTGCPSAAPIGEGMCAGHATASYST